MFREKYGIMEGTFGRTTRKLADAKKKHAMRYTYYRNLDQVQNWVKLKLVAMNIK